MRAAVLVATLLLLTSGSTEDNAKTTLDLEQNVILHLFEWKWEDIAKECEDFLAPRGFKVVQISPPTENLVKPGRPWFERYQTVTYDFTTRSGDEAALADMLKRCNKVGIRVIADVILNHMTSATKTDPCKGTGGNPCNANDFSYPHQTVQYEREHFHKPCNITDWKDVNQVRRCELLGLHDLDQAQEHVRNKMVTMMNRLVKLGVAGFRIDAAKHMDPDDLAAIFERLEDLNTQHGFPQSTKPYIFLEVIDKGNGDSRDASQFEDYIHLGHVTDMRYGVELGRLFAGNNPLKYLHNILTNWGLKPSDKSIVFVDNHDTEREVGDVLNYKSSQSYKMAIAFMLAIPHGTPQILSSYMFSENYQGPPVLPGTENLLSPLPLVNGFCKPGWVCQHRWRQIFSMVEFHNVVKGTNMHGFVSFSDYQIAFCRGNKGFIAFNLERHKAFEKKVQTCMPKGVYCDVISGLMKEGQCLGKKVTVGDNGEAMIRIEPFRDAFIRDDEQDGVLAIHAQSNILFKKPATQPAGGNQPATATQPSNPKEPEQNYICSKIPEWRQMNFGMKFFLDKLEAIHCKSRKS